jgi:hypothetical protein
MRPQRKLGQLARRLNRFAPRAGATAPAAIDSPPAQGHPLPPPPPEGRPAKSADLREASHHN